MTAVYPKLDRAAQSRGIQADATVEGCVRQPPRPIGGQGQICQPSLLSRAEREGGHNLRVLPQRSRWSPAQASPWQRQGEHSHVSLPTTVCNIVSSQQRVTRCVCRTRLVIVQ